jgi:hypothetical protein
MAIRVVRASYDQNHIPFNYDSNQVLLDLDKIVGEPGTNAEPVILEGETIGYTISYTQNTNGVGPNRVREIVNHEGMVYIYGTPCGQNYLPDMTEICNHAGYTYWDGDEDWGVDLVYNVTQCNDAFPYTLHYWVTGMNNQHIDFRNEVILFHELSHAWHILNGTHNDDVTLEQLSAIEDENLYRSERGMDLRNNNPSKIFGFGGCEQGAPKDTFSWSKVYEDVDCIIATSAYNSRYAPKVQELRKIRDNLLCSSIIGNKTLKHVLDEYYQFSPQVVKLMQKSPVLKKKVSSLLVEPLIEFFRLFELYIDATWDFKKNNFENEVKSSLKDYFDMLHTTQFDQDQIFSIAGRISNTKLFQNRRFAIPQYRTGYLDPLELFDYLDEIVDKSVPNNKYLTWAFATPLAIYWSAIREYLIRGEEDKLGKFLATKIDSWADKVPIPESFMSIEEEYVSEELDRLLHIMFTNKTRRQKFGKRLLSDYGNMVTYDLRKLLQRKKYL